MASAQLLYTNDKKSKSTKTAITAKSITTRNSKQKTTIQSLIERQQPQSLSYHSKNKNEKPSIFSNTELERTTAAEQKFAGNIKDTNAIRKLYNTNNNKTNTTTKTFCCYESHSKAHTTREREDKKQEGNSHRISKTEKSKYDIDTKFVFIAKQQQQQQQETEQLWPGTRPDGKCFYDKYLAATATAIRQNNTNNAAAVTKISHTDDVVVSLNGAGILPWQKQQQQQQQQQQRTASNIPNIDTKFYENLYDIALPDNTQRECHCRRRLQQSCCIISKRNSAVNRTIQQQQQYNNNKINNYNSDDDDDATFYDYYQGIEELNIHTNYTKMPKNENENSNNNSNNKNCYTVTSTRILSASGSNSNDISKIQSNFQNIQNPNETTKCCHRYVAKQQQQQQQEKYCCNICNYNKFYKTNSIQQQQISLSAMQKQRNFSFNTKQILINSTTTTNTTSKTQCQKQQQHQQKHKFTTLFIPTTTAAIARKFYQDLQKMSKYLLPLLVLLQMLPLFTAECDQTFVSRIGGPQNGTFSAPLLHNHKNHSRQCLYTFLAGPGQRVEVIFKTFNLRGNPPDGSAVGELPSCVHEYMDIYSEVQSSEPAELINSPFGGRYCGTIPPRQRISMYRAIAISFFTNKNITTPDLFEGTFRFINASEYEIGIPIAGSPCSYTITPSLSINKTGVLISPTYPGAYPKDMSCTYQFLGESNQRVRLEFRDFDLFFGGPHCPFDYVKIYDGPDNSSALIGTYCGQQRNLVLYSSESSLFVHFFTLSRTANTQNRGFKGIYEFSESFVKLDFIRENDGIHMRGSECDQKILSKKESTGFVLSPNYPYPYIPKTVCRYFIYGMQDAQHLERVRLEFTAFNIPRVESKDKDKETNCSDGYLKIYLKGQETADAYDKFDYELCGNETQRVVSDGPRLAMVFSSGELQGRGFKGKYVFETEYKIPGTAAPDGSCSFTYVSSSKKRGELNSPRYPSNYPSDTNCSYLFLAEPNEQVTIVFDHFKIKADGNSNATAGAYGSVICFEDWLEMYVVYRDNNDRFLGRYCGMTAPGPVESPKGAVGLRITLHTDQENVASGFKARYFFETAKSEIGDCGGNFSNEDSGIITSPNYPAGYKAPGRGMASMACNWLMTARPGYKLSIHFEQFSLEGDPASRGCPAAVLRLWVNVDSDQPPLELCGEKPPIEQWYYISTGQTARISFTTSDKTVGAQGFRIVWTEIQDSGPGPPSIGLLCESTYHFQCEVGYCISDKLRCDGVKNCGPNDDSDELHCTTKAQAEDHGVLIITTLLVVSFLICLLCILYHSRRKRRQQLHQLGLHRNAHYDSQTSATGLNSSRRHLQSGGASIAGSLHGINSGNLIIPPAPLPPRAIHQPPHICISGSSLDLGPGNYPGIMINGDSLDNSSTTSNDSIGSIPFLNECETDNMGHMILQQGETV